MSVKFEGANQVTNGGCLPNSVGEQASRIKKEVGMKTDNARILVIGAGVNGSVCAASLHKAGINVTILARGRRYEELRNEGIILEKNGQKLKIL